MKTIRTVSLTADITRKIQDWTRLLAQNAPAPEFVSDFHILSLSSHTVCARISYGRHGAAKLELYRFRESADDPDRGHMMTYTPPSGPPRTVYSEPITEIVGYDDDDYEPIRHDPNESMSLGSLELDTQQLFDLMIAVHDRLVPTALIAD